MRTEHVFDDGDVVVASTDMNTIIWTRIDGVWHNTALGSTTVTDQMMGENIVRETKNPTWHYVGSLFHRVDWDKCTQFRTSFYKD